MIMTTNNKLYFEVANEVVNDLFTNYTKNEEVDETLEIEFEGGLVFVHYKALNSEKPWAEVKDVEVCDGDGNEVEIDVDYDEINSYVKFYIGVC